MERLAESVEAIQGLLSGDTVTLRGRHVHLDGARLEDLPTTATGAPPVCLTIAGGNRALLTLAARRADVVGLSGLGRTLPDGHRHEVRWAPADLHAQLELVARHARAAGRTPVVEALVQVVEVTDDREKAAAGWARRLGPADIEHVLDTPFMLIGTHQEISEQLHRQARQWGLARYVVRGPAVGDLEPVLAQLARDHQARLPS